MMRWSRAAGSPRHFAAWRTRTTKVEHPQACRSSAERRIMAFTALRGAGLKENNRAHGPFPPRRVEEETCPRKSTMFHRSGRSALISTPTSTRRCMRARSRTRMASGPRRPSACTGTRRRPRSRTARSAPATSRSNGSRTASSTRPTTASIGTFPSAPTRPRSSGRVTTRPSPGTSPIASCTTRSASSPISCATATSRRATASPSICR